MVLIALFWKKKIGWLTSFIRILLRKLENHPAASRKSLCFIRKWHEKAQPTVIVVIHSCDSLLRNYVQRLQWRVSMSLNDAMDQSFLNPIRAFRLLNHVSHSIPSFYSLLVTQSFPSSRGWWRLCQRSWTFLAHQRSNPHPHFPASAFYSRNPTS